MAKNPQTLYFRMPLPEDKAPEEKVKRNHTDSNLNLVKKIKPMQKHQQLRQQQQITFEHGLLNFDFRFLNLPVTVS